MIGIPHGYLTTGLPGIGGRIKEELEDFIVEEVPLYHPVDQGEHTLFFMEKRDLSTLEAIERIAHALSVRPRDFGFAGLKDRKAVTRQMLSVRLVPPERILQLRICQIQIFWARFHKNKLRVGHLRGNRFRIRLRGVEPSPEKVHRVISEIQRRGLPNFYGPQRFGNRGDAFRIGRALIKRNYEYAIRRFVGYPMATERNPNVVEARQLFMDGDLKGALEHYPRSYRQERQILEYLLKSGCNYRKSVRLFAEPVRRLYFSAYQAYLFNQVLERRLVESENSPGQLYQGDLAWIHRSGAVFRVEEVEREQHRAEQFEISPSGPIFGLKMIKPEGLQGRIERELLSREEVHHGNFRELGPGIRMEGGRRPLRVPVRELVYHLDGNDLYLKFFLPKGSYATTFLREIMKNDEVPPGYLESGEAPPLEEVLPELTMAGPPREEGLERPSPSYQMELDSDDEPPLE